LNYLEN